MSGNIADAKDAIRQSSAESKIYVGADSRRYRRRGVWYARYTTVIVVHIDGCRGAKLFHDTVEMPDYGNIRQRMLNEVAFAVQHALDIVDVVGDREFQIHLDINRSPKHKSNTAMKEAIGYVIGTLGFEPKLKPYGFAASYAADHLVNH